MDSEQLANIIEKHGLWIKSGKQEWEKAEFNGADLQGADFRGTELQQANFREAILIEAYFQGANLKGTCFIAANLQRASLKNANFQQADFQDADLRGAYLERTDFKKTYLGDANIQNATLQEADLQEADLIGANLQWAELQGANLTRANLQEANLLEANLQGAYLQGAFLQGAFLQGANFRNSNLKDSDLRGVDLQGADLRDANLQDSNLQGANLQGANLLGASFKGANLQVAKIQGVDLQGTDLQKTNLNGANLVAADLRGADLRGSDLRSADLRNTKLNKANLSKAAFQGTDLKGADLNQTDLQQADFGFCIIDIHTYQAFLSETYYYEEGIKLVLPKNRFTHSNNIVRTIKFPPEYHQAGMAILGYFQTILNNKYPDDKVTVKINQEGFKVSMIIESPDGVFLEKAEKTLEQYGLIVRGKIPPEELYEDKYKVIELKTLLNNAENTLRNQRLLLDEKNRQNDLLESRLKDNEAQLKEMQQELLALLSESIKKPRYQPSIHVDASSLMSSNISPKFNINVLVKTEIPQIQGALNELKEELPSKTSNYFQVIERIEKALDRIKRCDNPEEVAKSSGMSKLSRFIEGLKDTESTIGKIVAHTKNGAGIAQKVIKHYNSIANWCGLPIVPDVF